MCSDNLKLCSDKMLFVQCSKYTIKEQCIIAAKVQKAKCVRSIPLPFPFTLPLSLLFFLSLPPSLTFHYFSSSPSPIPIPFPLSPSPSLFLPSLFLQGRCHSSKSGGTILLRAKRAENFWGLYPHICYSGGTTATKRGIGPTESPSNSVATSYWSYSCNFSQ